MKNEKGLTLIALIITIIVMLILVAVTVNVAINGGLFGEANNAATGTEEKAIYDQIVCTMVLKDNGKINVAKTAEAAKADLEGKGYKVTSTEITEGTTQVTLEVTGKKGVTFKYIITEEEIKGYIFRRENRTKESTVKIINEAKKLTQTIQEDPEDETTIKTVNISEEDLAVYVDADGNEDVYFIYGKVKDENTKQELYKMGIFPLMGDVNFDGKITIEDADLVSEFYSALCTLDWDQRFVADVSGPPREGTDATDIDGIEDIVNNKYNIKQIAISRVFNIDQRFLPVFKDNNGRIEVYYNLSKISDEDKIKLDECGIKPLYGDVDFDNQITEDDLELLEGFYAGSETSSQLQKIVGDFDFNDTIDSDDVITLRSIVRGTKSLNEIVYGKK